MKKAIGILLIIIVAVVLIVIFAGRKEKEAPDAYDPTPTPAQSTSMQTAILKTSMGDITLELYKDKAPKTVENFVTLAEKDFYDNTIFHRVIGPSPDLPKGFMLQGGDPEGNGTGGPGYTIPDEFDSSLTFASEGVLAMANIGQPNTGGSQFFITLGPTPWLNGKHTIFGKVTKGMEVVKSIGNVETNGSDKPLKDVVIKDVVIQ